MKLLCLVAVVGCLLVPPAQANKQLPACGGAHASAWPRCGSLLPALRV
ncbi:transmembrane protein 9 [Mus musculus]|nr:transmembrane protein 9 [Mus musculus]